MVCWRDLLDIGKCARTARGLQPELELWLPQLKVETGARNSWEEASTFRYKNSDLRVEVR